jgi:hypothetical protein
MAVTRTVVLEMGALRMAVLKTVILAATQLPETERTGI